MNKKEINKINKTIRKIFELKGENHSKARKLYTKLIGKYPGIEIYDGFGMKQY